MLKEECVMDIKMLDRQGLDIRAVIHEPGISVSLLINPTYTLQSADATLIFSASACEG